MFTAGAMLGRFTLPPLPPMAVGRLGKVAAPTPAPAAAAAGRLTPPARWLEAAGAKPAASASRRASANLACKAACLAARRASACCWVGLGVGDLFHRVRV